LSDTQNNTPEAWVVAEIEEDHLRECTLEVLDDMRKVADQRGERCCVVLIGDSVSNFVQTLGCYRVDKVYLVEHPLLSGCSTDLLLKALEELVRKCQPFLVAGSATPNGHELMARLAAHLEASFIPDCISFKIQPDGVLQALKPVYQETAYASISCKATSPVLVTMRPGILGIDLPGTFRQPEITHFVPQLSQEDVRVRCIRKIPADPARMDIREAQSIVAGGRGVKDRQGWILLENLASLLGASVAGSRAALDLGWIERNRMVGQTGKTVKPRLYVAAGISGSYYHMRGVETENLIAINKDRNSPVLKSAKTAIVGDLYEILPILIQKLEDKQKKDQDKSG